MYLTIAIHHPHPDHVEDMVNHMRRVREATGEPAGLVDFRGWRNTDGTTLAGVATWVDEEAFRAALPRIGSLRAERRPEWSAREDELLTFHEL